jgi:hypothetical protein
MDDKKRLQNLAGIVLTEAKDYEQSALDHIAQASIATHEAGKPLMWLLAAVKEQYGIDKEGKKSGGY